MNKHRIDRRVRKAVSKMELLESRCLLSATLTSNIPTQDIAVGSTPAPLSLGTYFNDPTVTGTAVEIQTPLGNIPLVLTDSATPQTVANFKEYITSGEYANTIIHRSVPGFIIQGGGYDTDGTHIQTFGTIPGEFATATLKNTTGTIAMALTGTLADPMPNSGTSEWFINLGNNPSLDTGDGGPFTAFGSVVYNGMNVVNAIAALPIVNDSTQSGAWNTIPVQSGSSGATVSSEPASNLVAINPIILPGGLSYSVTSSNPSLVAATVDASGNLTLTPASGGGMAKITVTATDMGGGTATSTFAADITSASPIVTLGAGGAKTCTYTDAGGAVTVVSMNGAGTATLDFGGTNIQQVTVRKGVSVTGNSLGLTSITTSGTTSASALSITTHGGAAVSIGSVTTDSLRSFAGKSVTLTGNFTSSASVGMLALAGATGATISAGSLGSISIGGGFDDGIDLTGSGVALKTFKAGSITGGMWSVSGAAQAIAAGSVANWSPDFAQTVKSLTVKGDFDGSLTAASIGTVSISGSTSGGGFHFTGTGKDLAKLTVGGALSSEINSLGSIGTVTVGSLTNGEIYAGVGTLSNSGVLPASAGDFAASAAITSVKVKTSFSNSDIAATTLGMLSLGTLQTSNGGMPTGVAGETLKSLAATANKKFTLKNETGSVTSLLTADGVVLGDVIIDLLGTP